MRIEFQNITKKYNKFVALNNISIQLEGNKSYALLGPNGSGKTTFIKSILGMVVPGSGNLTVNGENVKHGYQYRKQIGYMPQIGQYPNNMTVKHVFDMMKDLRNTADYELDEELMDAYQIGTFWNKKTAALSGGTRQKMSACLAFLFNPDILILDEPTAGLDPLSSEILKEKIIRETQKNKLILITSHILSDLDEIITDVIYLQDGEILMADPIHNLRRDTGEKALSKIIAGFIKQHNKVNQHA